MKKKIKKYLYFLLAFFILLVGLYVYWSFFFTYIDGYHAGTLEKFSRKGTIFKTYEGEMVLSSVQNKVEASSSDKFQFSVADHDVAVQLEQMQGKDIVVHYTQKNNTLPWRGETVFIVNSVKFGN